MASTETMPRTHPVAKPRLSGLAPNNPSPITLKASIVVPCFNERATVNELLDRVQAVPIDKEVIVVDDCSTDGTRELLQQRAIEKGDIVLRLMPRNSSKGAAVKEGLRAVRGDVVIIQDADLEYNPADYPSLLSPIERGEANAVYGSRFHGVPRAMSFLHRVGNKALTLICNALFHSKLSDMETCYKVFTADIARKLDLTEPRWGFDPEITAKILRMGQRIHEVPISYAAREFDEGKKINTVRDGAVVLRTLLRYRFLP